MTFFEDATFGGGMRIAICSAVAARMVSRLLKAGLPAGLIVGCKNFAARGPRSAQLRWYWHQVPGGR